jgi:hypothetical protein
VSFEEAIWVRDRSKQIECLLLQRLSILKGRCCATHGDQGDVHRASIALMLCGGNQNALRLIYEPRDPGRVRRK